MLLKVLSQRDEKYTQLNVLKENEIKINSLESISVMLILFLYILNKSMPCNLIGFKVGLGFGQFPNYPGGIEYFLSVGKNGLFEGEGYKKIQS